MLRPSLVALGMLAALAGACVGAPSQDAVAHNEEAISALRTRTGEVLRGEVVARYNHRIWWWDQAEETTLALFDASRTSEIPGQDRSLRFVRASDLSPATVIPEAPQVMPAAYDQFLRGRGMELERAPLEGVASVLNGNERWHEEEAGYGDFAWDLVRTDAAGLRFSGSGAANTDYLVWDAPVFLPTGGTVVDLVDSAPDNPPGVMPQGPLQSVQNNMVGVHVAGSYYVYLLHFKQASIPRAENGNCAPAVPGVRCLAVGQWLPAGSYLGRVGNSGVTLEPHLHLTTYFWDTEHAPARSYSVPSVFRALYLRGQGEPAARFRTHVVPETGGWLSAAPF